MATERRTEIIPYIFYRDVPAALDFLSRAFGFTELMRIGKPSGMHAEMTLDGQKIMMGQGSKDWGMVAPIEAGAATQGVFIYLQDVDAHHATAAAAGAEISAASARGVVRPHLQRTGPGRPSVVFHHRPRGLIRRRPPRVSRDGGRRARAGRP